jgi:hypothetical protein
MDSRKDYLQKVLFQLSAYGKGDGFSNKYMTSWEEVNRELIRNSDFGGMIGKSIAGTELFIKDVITRSSELEKMTMVYNYVRSNINWNGGNSKFAPDGLKGAWQKKSGTAAEINFILLNLLKAAGLQADPLLVSERWHGRVDTKLPFIDQFNVMIVSLKINGTSYYLDARNKFTPAHIIPNSILNTTAFLVNKKSGSLVNISNESLGYKETVFTKLKITADGAVEGSTNVGSAEYARVKKQQQYSEDKSDFLNDNFKDAKLAVEIKKFDLKNADNDSLDFIQTCDFTSKLGTTGDYSFIPLNLFSGFTQNPFVRNERFSNVNFGYKRFVNVITEITLPKEFMVEGLPKSIQLTNPEKDIMMSRTIEYNKEEQKISAIIRIEFSKSLYMAEDYPVLQAFYKKMFEYLDEPVLLKKQ